MKIIITDCDHDNIEVETAVFQEAGMEFSLLQCKTEQNLIDQCAGADIFINQYAPITRRVMEALPSLKFVIRYGVGVDNIDLKAASELGVQVNNVPDYGTSEVADQAITFLMALSRKLVPMVQHTKNEGWDYARSIPVRRLSTQVVGVIGLGRIGFNFATKAHALGFHVIGYDTHTGLKGKAKYDFIDICDDLETLLRQADAVSLHCPLDTSRGLIGEAQLRMMKPTACLINTARGGIVDEAALYQALSEGWIASAGFDVMSREPIPRNSPLLGLDNFLCTPHMSWYSEEAAQELKRKVAEESVRFANGSPVHYPVNHPSQPR